MADPTDEDTSYRELLKDRDALTQQVSALQAELARVREETKSAFLTGARMMEERDAARAKLAEVERSLSGEMAASAELTRQLDCARGWERRNFKRANSLESQLAAYRTVVDAARQYRDAIDYGGAEGPRRACYILWRALDALPAPSESAKGEPPAPAKCSECGGSGQVLEYVSDVDTEAFACDRCQGTGEEPSR
jgi:hypothetical protein